jgi:ABC-type transport system substrate-binding protein
MLNVQYLGLNVQRVPFDDVRVRRALALAVDREQLSSYPLPGYHFPAIGGFIPPGMPEHSLDIGLPFNPARARELLAEAGFAGGENFPQLTGLAPAVVQVVVERMSQSWREILGINVTWQFEAWKELLKQLTGQPPDLFLIGWRADYPDPDNLLRVSWHRVWTGWRNQAYDDLVRHARRVADHARRIEMYRQADKILIEDAAIVPLVYGRRHLLVKPWVTRLPTSVVGWHFWKDVVIEPH